MNVSNTGKKEDTKRYLETNKNENTAQTARRWESNPKRKIRSIKDYLKKHEKGQINNLTLYHKT